MEVILLEELGKLGKIGDKVAVKAGFGRNYLIPKGIALPATASNLAQFEQRRAELEAAADERKAAAGKKAAELAELNIIITAKAGDEGKLFGSIGTRDIADKISQAGVEVVKSEVRLPDGVLRELGEYDVDIQLHSEITQQVKISIEAE